MVKSLSNQCDTCRACGETNLELAIPLAPTPLADAYVGRDQLRAAQDRFPLDCFICKDCGQLQLRDFVDPDALYGNFIYCTSNSPGLVEHFRNYTTQVIERAKPSDGGLVVDIGSNDGTLLRFFKERGMRVLGIDPAREIALKATASGIETLPAYFNMELARKLRAEHGPASLIVSNNTMANIDALDEFIGGIRKLLAPDGVFVFETIYMADMVRRSHFDNIYHEHIYYFSVKPLDRLFRRHKMQLIEVQRIPTLGGSLRGYVQLAEGPRRQSPSVDELLKEEDETGIHQAETFTNFSAQLDEAKTRLLDLLRTLKAQGKSIAGYGASHSVTTLLFHFGLGEFLDFLVDDNPVKQGLYSPGYHIPVYAPDALYEKRPDYVVLLAWRFDKQMKAKHRAYLENGGHFITPLPELEVI